MRSYPRNSPEAAARVLALLLIADGNVCRSEIQALESLDASAALGLAPDGFASIVQGLCEDLMLSASAGEWPCSLDEATLAALLGEVDEPALRRKVLALASAAAQADRHLADAEQRLLDELRTRWQVDAGPEPAQPTQARQVAQPVAAQPADREHAHAARGEHRHQCAVLELAGDVRPQAFGLEPALQRRAQRRVPGGQQHRQAFERAREVVHLRLVHQRGRPVPLDRRHGDALAGQAQAGVVRRRLAGEHQVEPVQREVGEQGLELAVVAHQAQPRRRQHRRQQSLGGQLRQPVGHADGQAHPAAARRGAHLVGNGLAELEDRLGAREGGLPGLGQHDCAARRLQQLVAEHLFELAHLGTDGLDRHVQAHRRAREAAFLGDDPEVVEMAVVQHGHGGSDFWKPRSLYRRSARRTRNFAGMAHTELTPVIAPRCLPPRMHLYAAEPRRLPDIPPPSQGVDPMTALSSTQTEKLMADLRLVVTDAEALLRATAGQAGNGAAELRTKVEANLARARDGLAQIQDTAVAQAKVAGRHADEYVHENPWRSIGIAAAVGLVVGVLIGRR
jgi:ElaB/YqjD/DUF883 family membrane-anchored ribosome-binding protein